MTADPTPAADPRLAELTEALRKATTLFFVDPERVEAIAAGILAHWPARTATPEEYRHAHFGTDGHTARCWGGEPARTATTEAEALAAATRETLVLAQQALGGYRWLHNNLHNADTRTFRELFEAANEDTVRAYDAIAAALAATEPVYHVIEGLFGPRGGDE